MVRLSKVNAFLLLPVGVMLLAAVGSFIKLHAKFCYIKTPKSESPSRGLVWAVCTRLPRLLSVGR